MLKYFAFLVLTWFTLSSCLLPSVEATIFVKHFSVSFENPLIILQDSIGDEFNNFKKKCQRLISEISISKTIDYISDSASNNLDGYSQYGYSGRWESPDKNTVIIRTLSHHLEE